MRIVIEDENSKARKALRGYIVNYSKYLRSGNAVLSKYWTELQDLSTITLSSSDTLYRSLVFKTEEEVNNCIEQFNGVYKPRGTTSISSWSLDKEIALEFLRAREGIYGIVFIISPPPSSQYFVIDIPSLFYKREIEKYRLNVFGTENEVLINGSVPLSKVETYLVKPREKIRLLQSITY